MRTAPPPTRAVTPWQSVRVEEHVSSKLTEPPPPPGIDELELYYAAGVYDGLVLRGFTIFALGLMLLWWMIR